MEQEFESRRRSAPASFRPPPSARCSAQVRRAPNSSRVVDADAEPRAPSAAQRIRLRSRSPILAALAGQVDAAIVAAPTSAPCRDRLCRCSKPASTCWWKSRSPRQRLGPAPGRRGRSATAASCRSAIWSASTPPWPRSNSIVTTPSVLRNSPAQPVQPAQPGCGCRARSDDPRPGYRARPGRASFRRRSARRVFRSCPTKWISRMFASRSRAAASPT